LLNEVRADRVTYLRLRRPVAGARVRRSAVVLVEAVLVPVKAVLVLVEAVLVLVEAVLVPVKAVLVLVEAARRHGQTVTTEEI